MTCHLGATMVGGIHGARTMAISIAADDHGSILRWHAAAAVTQVVLPGLLEAPAKTVLNLNVPNLDLPTSWHHCAARHCPVAGSPRK